MLTILIFNLCIISMLVLTLVFPSSDYSLLFSCLTIVVSVVVEIAISGIMAIIACKWLPDKYFRVDHWMYKVSKTEQNFYKWLQVKKWKDISLELGILNHFPKNKIHPKNIEYLEKFIMESNRGYLGHLLGIIFGTIAIFFLPQGLIFTIGIPLLIGNFVINYMSVAILRYNIPRLQIALKYAT